MKRLVEHHSLMSVKQHPPLGEVLHGGCQHVALDVASSVGQLLRAHAVVDADNVLLDNRTLIQIAGDEVRGGTDNLDTTVVGLVVRLGALKRRQEAVVNVDDTARHSLAQGGGEDLHVAGQDDEVDVVLFDELQDAGLLLLLGILADRQVDEGDVVGGREGGKVRVVGYDEGDIDGELAGRGTEEEVVEAVTDLGDHDQDAGLLGGGDELEVHGEGLGRGLEGLTQLVNTLLSGILVSGEMRAHEESVRCRIAELR